MDEKWVPASTLIKANEDAAKELERLKNEVEKLRVCLFRQAKINRLYSDVLHTIADWPFDIMGDCVAEAKDLARKALEGE